MTHWSLWAELAAQRMRQDLRDAEGARRVREAEEGSRRQRQVDGPGRGVFARIWGAVRAAVYAVGRASG